MYMISLMRKESYFQVKALVLLKVFHPHRVLCCSQSHGYWFIYLFCFLLFLVLGVKHIHSLGPWLFAWHMHDWVSWLHTLFSHSLGSIHVCLFFYELCHCVIHAHGFLCFLCVSPVPSLCCLYCGFTFSWLLPNILLSLPLPPLLSPLSCPPPLSLRCFRWPP